MWMFFKFRELGFTNKIIPAYLKLQLTKQQIKWNNISNYRKLSKFNKSQSSKIILTI